MAYSFTNSRGKTYFLHAKARALKSGKQQLLYFFAGKTGAGALDALPKGYVVSETKNGLPVLKRAK
jgi:hypothetical protein